MSLWGSGVHRNKTMNKNNARAWGRQGDMLYSILFPGVKSFPSSVVCNQRFRIPIVYSFFVRTDANFIKTFTRNTIWRSLCADRLLRKRLNIQSPNNLFISEESTSEFCRSFYVSETIQWMILLQVVSGTFHSVQNWNR